jgi:hypothetical protein
MAILLLVSLSGNRALCYNTGYLKHIGAQRDRSSPDLN